MLGAQIRRHVGFHQEDVHFGVDDEIEANHLEEAAPVRVLGRRLDEVGLLHGVNIPVER